MKISGSPALCAPVSPGKLAKNVHFQILLMKFCSLGPLRLRDSAPHQAPLNSQVIWDSDPHQLELSSLATAFLLPLHDSREQMAMAFHQPGEKQPFGTNPDTHSF